METCRICGVSLSSTESQQRGCCDVPHFESVEEQMGFWLAHDPQVHCARCEAAGCERKQVVCHV